MTIYEYVNAIRAERLDVPWNTLRPYADLFPAEQTDFFVGLDGALLIGINRANNRFIVAADRLCLLGFSDTDIAHADVATLPFPRSRE